MANLYEIPVRTLSGESTKLAPFRGQVLLIVNVASKCGLTRQYTELEQLHSRLHARGFSVLGFPSNDFAGQEPGSDQEIAEFCSSAYQVTFPLFSKAPVTGPDKHPLYAELTASVPEPVSNGSAFRARIDSFLQSHNLPGANPSPEILWNFEKFVIGRDGTVLARFSPDIPPDDPRLLQVIESALAA